MVINILSPEEHSKQKYLSPVEKYAYGYGTAIVPSVRGFSLTQFLTFCPC